MKGIYRHILNVSFIMTTVWFSSCSNEENLGGELKELKTISSITINQTIYIHFDVPQGRKSHDLT